MSKKLQLGENITIYQGDCLESLRTMESGSVHCVITYPPYYGLRDYGTAQWEGGDPECDHVNEKQRNRNLGKDVSEARQGRTADESRLRDGVSKIDMICHKCGARRIDQQLGLESTPEEYIDKMVTIFREIRRVLRDDGTVWLNMGDSYWGGKGQSGQGSPEYQAARRDVSINKPHHHIGGPKQTRPSDGKHHTLKSKDLCGIPWRLALALQADGWWLRQDIVWAKPNPMPESCEDRCTKASEYLFLLAKKPRYYFDNEAIKEQANLATQRDRPVNATRAIGNTSNGDRRINYEKDRHVVEARNKRSVWTIPTQPFPGEFCKSCKTFFEQGFKNMKRTEDDKPICPICGAFDQWLSHYATFPLKLVEPCILAGTSEVGCCPQCGKPWERVVEKETYETRPIPKNIRQDELGKIHGDPGRHCTNSKTIGWSLSCECGGEPAPCVVLDPFMGSGTTAMAAIKHGRRCVGIELNEDYAEMTRQRIEKELKQPYLW